MKEDEVKQLELQAGKVKLDINYNVNQDLGSDLLFPKSMQHY